MDVLHDATCNSDSDANRSTRGNNNCPWRPCAWFWWSFWLRRVLCIFLNQPIKLVLVAHHHHCTKLAWRSFAVLWQSDIMHHMPVLHLLPIWMFIVDRHRLRTGQWVVLINWFLCTVGKVLDISGKTCCHWILWLQQLNFRLFWLRPSTFWSVWGLSKPLWDYVLLLIKLSYRRPKYHKHPVLSLPFWTYQHPPILKKKLSSYVHYCAKALATSL